MSEDTNKEKAAPKAPEGPVPDTKPKDAPAVEALQTPAGQKPAGDSAPVAADKKEDKKQAVIVKKEKPVNCAKCSKPIRKKRWYYRNGKYYCTKRCWKSTVEKEPKQEAAPASK